MIGLILVCLHCISMVATNNSNSKMFELRLDQQLGILGCRRQCENRDGCIDIIYSPNKLACVLKLNSSSNLKQEKGDGTVFCVKRSVQTTSRRTVKVCDMHEYPSPKDDQITHDETRLGFRLLSTDRCRVSGKHQNILEVSRSGSLGLSCQARVDQTFLSNGTYSWTLSVTQTNNVSTSVLFCFTSSLNDKIISSFSLSNQGGFFEIRKWYYKRLLCRSIAMLNFALSQGTLNITDLNTDDKVLFERMKPLPAKFYLLLRITEHGTSDHKVVLNEKPSVLCN